MKSLVTANISSEAFRNAELIWSGIPTRPTTQFNFTPTTLRSWIPLPQFYCQRHQTAVGNLSSLSPLRHIAFPLEFRLRALGFNIPVFIRDDRYIAIDAVDMLSKIMVDGCPDERLFKKLAGALLARAQKNGRRVRAFGEMVSLLWDKGNKSATIRLENLWDDFCRSEGFSLFCAYPSSSFGRDAEASITEICLAHSKVITAPTPCATVSAARHAVA